MRAMKIIVFFALGCFVGTAAYAEGADSPQAYRAFGCFSQKDTAAVIRMHNEGRDQELQKFAEAAFAEDRCVPTILTGMQLLDDATIDSDGVKAVKVYPYKGLHARGLSIPESFDRAREDFLAGNRPDQQVMYVFGNQ